MRENEQEVLEYLNGLRVEYGIGEPLAELPPDQSPDEGRPSENCPVAVALERRCGTDVIFLPKGEDYVRIVLPEFVAKFQRDHDLRWVLKRNARS